MHQPEELFPIELNFIAGGPELSNEPPAITAAIELQPQEISSVGGAPEISNEPPAT